MAVDYNALLQDIIEIVTPNNANSNSANSFVGSIGGRCGGKGGASADPGKLNTQVKHLEERLTTLEEIAIGLYVTLCAHAKNMAEANDEELKEIGKKMQEYFYDGTEKGLDKIAEEGGDKAGETFASKGFGDEFPMTGLPQTPRGGNVDPGGGWGSGGGTGGGTSGGTGGGGVVGAAGAAGGTNIPFNVLQIPRYSSFTNTIRNRTANTFNANVYSINSSQNYIRAEYATSVVITTK